MRLAFVRVRGDAWAAIAPIRSAIQPLRPDLPWADIRPLAALVDPHIRPWRLGATLFSAFGAIALVLAALGLYAVIAYSVAQRTAEVGIRVALGARSSDITRLVLSQSLRQALAGVSAGLAVAWLAARPIQPLLFQVSARDPIVLGGVIMLMLAVSLAAALAPLRRALRIDPVIALKQE